MEINQKQQNRSGEEPQEAASAPGGEMNDVSPTIPVVRTNTPRPLSFASMLSHASQGQRDEPVPFQLPRFPSMAPSAPPLPEELGEDGEESIGESPAPVPFSGPGRATLSNGGRDFVWLFEYGLEMDPAMLNSAERLDGLALLYGSAVLRGYALMLATVEYESSRDIGARTVASIVPDASPGAEVWGVLYRVPRRLTERVEGEPSVLDTVHFSAVAPTPFSEIQIVVNDPYRKREITCIAYAATEQARKQIAFVPITQVTETLFAQRLVELARKQKLPDRYLSKYSSQQATRTDDSYTANPIATTGRSQDTDPLPVMKETGKVGALTNTLPETPPGAAQTQPAVAPAVEVPGGLLLAFAIYLIVTMLAVLTFAVVQGLGFASDVLNANFVPLGVPWLVLLYGLLGGCISCITMLGRYRAIYQPYFVIISWFTRPYIGAILAALAYLALNSGIFAVKVADNQHLAVSLLFGAIAGLCEGWIFFRSK